MSHSTWKQQYRTCSPKATCSTTCHSTWMRAELPSGCCSLRDMLYRRRMERQLAQARGLMSGEGKMPPPEDGEVSTPAASLRVLQACMQGWDTGVLQAANRLMAFSECVSHPVQPAEQ